MSFEATEFSVIAYANGFTHWHYRSPDNLNEILAPTYFAPAAAMLRPGDQITFNLLHPGAIGLAHCVVAGLAEGRPSLVLLAVTPEPQPTRAAA